MPRVTFIWMYNFCELVYINLVCRKICHIGLYFVKKNDIIREVTVMKKRRDGAMQDEFISRMIKNLPVLRAAIDLTQEQLGTKLGVSRQTIVAIENGKSPLTWSLYLAMVCVFGLYEESRNLIEKLELFDADFIFQSL